jgi:hypothetical protein
LLDKNKRDNVRVVVHCNCYCSVLCVVVEYTMTHKDIVLSSRSSCSSHSSHFSPFLSISPFLYSLFSILSILFLFLLYFIIICYSSYPHSLIPSFPLIFSTLEEKKKKKRRPTVSFLRYNPSPPSPQSVSNSIKFKFDGLAIWQGDCPP